MTRRVNVMRDVNVGIPLALVGALAAALLGCGSAQSAARRDPMKCERDPACAKARSGYTDCSFQCNDDPACMDRCREMESDRIGHP